MKFVSHGRKMNKLGARHEWIEVMVELLDLLGLVCASYDTADKWLLSSFVKR